jgi:hypothetical protein
MMDGHDTKQMMPCRAAPLCDTAEHSMCNVADMEVESDTTLKMVEGVPARIKPTATLAWKRSFKYIVVVTFRLLLPLSASKTFKY